ncbi:PadR family transcriptional regulator [Egibacter rhizosphaerae]|uniref:PadR family transcriptional regulator n=1 Tax=Egibacter rhizosphaerae TaxID=1670831 RepID=UPI0013F167BB|nr:PadR family transcriptional regulator [Egibacter rhizosphaerae]
MLELAVLGLLLERPLHGYELRKQLSQRLGLFWSVSFGSLYPTLARLERRGDVEKLAPADRGSRRKQAYQVTEQGRARFLELLEEGSRGTDDERFRLRLAFFRHLGPESRLRHLERRREVLAERLDERERSLAHAESTGTDAYTLSLLRHGVRTTAHDLAWLDDLLAAERTGFTPTDPHP